MDAPKSVIAAMTADAAATLMKFIAAGVTGSSAMLSQAIQSMVDTGDTVLLLMGTRLSRKPADRAHPLGHGRELYFWTMIVAAVIFGAGGGINVFEGVSRIIHPQPARHLVWSYAVLAGAAVLGGISLVFARREYRKVYRYRPFFPALRASKDPTTFAVLLEDGSDLLGIATAFLGISLGHWLRMPMLDGVASVIIGGILASVAFLLGRECHGLLIGEAASDEMIRRIQEVARIDDRIEQIGDPLTIYLGPHDIVLALSVQFRKDLEASELAKTIDQMESAIRRTAPDVNRIFVEAESVVHARKQRS
jgi:cation diffusion facilitator family transporter